MVKKKNFIHVILMITLLPVLVAFNNCSPSDGKGFEALESLSPTQGNSPQNIDSDLAIPPGDQRPPNSGEPPVTSLCPLPQSPLDMSQCPLPLRKGSGSNANFQAFENAWWHFKERYAYFKERRVDWNCEYKRAVDMMGVNPTKNEMTQALESLLENLQDGHVSFKGDSFVDYGKSNPYRHKSKIQTIYLDGGGTCPSKKLCYGSLKKNNDIGYIRLDLVEGAVSPAKISSALETLKNKKALIVDLRFNDGGFDSTALSLMGHFTNKSILSHYKEDKRAEGFVNKRRINIIPKKPFLSIPVYVLSSPITASASEIGIIAANALANQPSSMVTTIGGRSEGITSDIVTYKGNGLTIDYSGERYSSPEPDCFIFERTGVSVKHDSGYASINLELKDRLAAFDQYLAQSLNNNIDPDIEKALTLFSQ